MIYWIAGPIIAFGICLSGADGPWFPWPNLAGMLIVAGACIAMHKLS